MRALLLLLAASTAVQAADSPPLVLESTIPLGEVRGRIDHLAADPLRGRLFVAELGNDTLGVIDLHERRIVRTIQGLKEPQGIGYVPSTDTIYVANAADGSVRLFQGVDLRPAGQIALGDDADNVRVDDEAHQIWVGYGNGALAVIDPRSRSRIADIPLRAHPESFRFDRRGYVFVNVPDAHEVAVVDRTTLKQTGGWPTGAFTANFPLVVDESGQRVLVVFRRPATLAVFSQEGKLLKTVETCGDSDDAFIDAKRNRVYVICGEGYIDVLAAGDYSRLGRILTSPGARTGLFVPEFDRLIVAVRARNSTPAALWLYRPLP
jgi:DNA-binding beta-propeller fold protein YncE